jgi:hypothetical protein
MSRSWVPVVSAVVFLGLCTGHACGQTIAWTKDYPQSTKAQTLTVSGQVTLPMGWTYKDKTVTLEVWVSGGQVQLFTSITLNQTTGAFGVTNTGPLNSGTTYNVVAQVRVTNGIPTLIRTPPAAVPIK